MCDHLANVTTLECVPGMRLDACRDTQYLCQTCGGFPDGHPECSGLRFIQNFQDIPRSMWYMMVTISTVGYGDFAPVTVWLPRRHRGMSMGMDVPTAMCTA